MGARVCQGAGWWRRRRCGWLGARIQFWCNKEQTWYAAGACRRRNASRLHELWPCLWLWFPSSPSSHAPTSPPYKWSNGTFTFNSILTQLNKIAFLTHRFHTFLLPCFACCFNNACELLAQVDDIPPEQHALVPSFMGTTARGKRIHPLPFSDPAFPGNHLTQQSCLPSHTPNPILLGYLPSLC